MALPSIQFGGISSGLDTKAIITALMEAEKAPLTRLQNRGTAIKARQTAYQALGTSLNTLLAKVQAFTLMNAGSARSAQSSDPTRYTAIANTGAVPGQYRVKVDALATATRATSTAALGTSITDATATGMLSSLPLPGAVTAGTLGLVVDGKVLSISVGDPATTSLKSVLDTIAAAVQAQVGMTDASTVVSASISGNKVSLSISGASSDHDLRVGVSGDTSNFAAITGLAGLHAADFGVGATSATGSSLLGVARTTAILDAAGLTGLASTATGKLTINGVDIAYDTTTDTLSAMLSRINSSQAGVIASVDRTNDKVVLTSKATGARAISIVDTSGTLGAALGLAPGTIGAQLIGQGSQVTVDGRTVTSDSNTVANAIDGVTLTLVDQSTSTSTLTVGVDTSAVAKALTELVDSYNALADTIEQVTTHAQGAPAAPLEGDANIASLTISLRSMMMGTSSAFTSGTILSLGDVGVNSGAIGAKPGTTTRLKLDADKLSTALTSDPARVAALLGSAGGIMQPLITQVKRYTSIGGVVDSAVRGMDQDIRDNARAQVSMQERVDMRQAVLEAKFASLEATLSRLQSTSASLTSTVNSMTGNSNSR